MLGNQDFARMVSSGAASSSSNGGGGGEKVRFDLKTVKRWDKEARGGGGGGAGAASKPHRGLSKKSKWNASAEDEDTGSAATDAYRDRAQERRKEEAVATAAEAAGTVVAVPREISLEERVAALDAAQSQLVGGDLEHTHLVRGLDYALLHKVRREAGVGATTGVEEDEEDGDGEGSGDWLTGTETEEVVRRARDHARREDDRQEEQRRLQSGGDLTQEGHALQPKTKLGRSLQSLLFTPRNGSCEGGGKCGVAGLPTTSSGAGVVLQLGRGGMGVGRDNGVSTGGGKIEASLLAPGASAAVAAGSRFNNGGSSDCGGALVSSIAAQALARTVFEFDTNPESDQDIPIVVNKSKKDIDDRSGYRNFSLDSALYRQLQELFLVTGKLQNREKEAKKKKLKMAEVGATVTSSIGITAATAVPALGQTDFDSIYDDDIVARGKYDPTAVAAGRGACTGVTEHNSKSISDSGNGCSSSGPIVKSMNIFGDLYVGSSKFGASASTASAFSGSAWTGAGGSAGADALVTGGDVYSDLLKPVNALLQAQAKKERAKARGVSVTGPAAEKGGAPVWAAGSGAAVTNLEMAVEKDQIHRDVFATTAASMPVEASRHIGNQGKLAESFGLHGSYDLYPQEDNSDDDGASDPGSSRGVKRSHWAVSAAGGSNSGSRGGSSSRTPATAGGSSGGSSSNWRSSLAAAGEAGPVARKMKISTPWTRVPGGH